MLSITIGGRRIFNTHVYQLHYVRLTILFLINCYMHNLIMLYLQLSVVHKITYNS